MSDDVTPQGPRFFSERDPSSCRIETSGGTVYWISQADDEGYRWVLREQLQSSETNTMVMQKFSQSKDSLDLGDKFRARLAGDIQQGMPFVLEVEKTETRILSEIVVDLEAGKVPEMIFR